MVGSCLVKFRIILKAVLRSDTLGVWGIIYDTMVYGIPPEEGLTIQQVGLSLPFSHLGSSIFPSVSHFNKTRTFFFERLVHPQKTHMVTCSQKSSSLSFFLKGGEGF